MRVTQLVLFALAAFLVTVIVRFPAAPVLSRLEPDLRPMVLEGIEGPLIGGEIARVRSIDDLLPLEFTDVGWSLAPLRLFRGLGANVDFAGYGGGGEGKVTRSWSGRAFVEDLTFEADAKAFETLLPVPLASFSGRLDGDVDTLVVENGNLARLDGRLSWTEALLETPVRASLGTLDVGIEPDGDETHTVTLTATGGDVAVDGTMTLALNGDFDANVLLTPAADAPPDVLSALSRMARPESGGRFRWQQSGNINRLM